MDSRTRTELSDAEVESIVSASSDEIEHCGTEEHQVKMANCESYGKDIAKLFQTGSPLIKNKVDASWFSPLYKKIVP